ncbi:MAG: hypothetical protein SF123_09435 [Chloroflexota bacterium]|nr:hypothetical protein [Chloroflexota bacterium]
MLTLINSQSDAALAQRIRRDVSAAGYGLTDSARSREDVALLVLSQAALTDAQWQGALNDALDRGQHIVPIQADATPLPKLIDHLTPVDMRAGYTFAPLHAAIDAALSPDAGLALKVLTPATRRSNNQSGLVVGLIALAMFIIGVIGVAVFNIEAPIEEFNAIDTQVALTRDPLIAPTLESYLRFLPGSPDEAAVYAATVEAVPTRLRPFVAATATAVAIDFDN